MNLKEAQEAINTWGSIVDDCAQKEIPIPDDESTTRKQMLFLIAKGHLEAIEQMKPVVEALEKIAFAVTDVIENKQTLILKMVAGKALQAYRRNVLGDKS